MTITKIPLLDEVRVAAPCPKRWDDMLGGDRVRFCRSCEKNVYNLSEMTRDEAENLLQTHEGGLCVHFYRRSDGTIMTQNCPVGLRAIRRNVPEIRCENQRDRNRHFRHSVRHSVSCLYCRRRCKTVSALAGTPYRLCGSKNLEDRSRD